MRHGSSSGSWVGKTDGGEKRVRLASAERKVEELIRADLSAAELSDRVFGPDGVFTRVGTTRRRREALVKHTVYRRAQARLTELKRKEAARSTRTSTPPSSVFPVG